MPLYDYECTKCKKVAEHYAKVDETTQPCPACGKRSKRILTSRYYAHGDMEPYLDENIGTDPVWVESRQHRKKLMSEHGVSEGYGKGWT